MKLKQFPQTRMQKKDNIRQAVIKKETWWKKWKDYRELTPELHKEDKQYTDKYETL